MECIILGSQSGSPTRQRQTSSMALWHDHGEVWLFDAGEATQHQLLRTKVRPARISTIFISHCHGDHIFGLPGVLSSIMVHGRSTPVRIIGPLGLRAWIEHCLSFSDTHFEFELQIEEIDLGIGAAPETLRPIGSHQWQLEIVPLPHRQPSMACILRQPPSRGAVDSDKAASLGLSGPELGHCLAQLSEQDYFTQGERRYYADDLLGPERDGLILVLCGDSGDSAKLVEHIHQPDLLYHECTYLSDRADHAVKWGHTHAQQLGELAKQLAPRQLIATHFSSRYTAGDGPQDLSDLANEICLFWGDLDAAQKLFMANDLKSIEL